MRLKGSVGQNGRNIVGDVTYVQMLLADWQMTRNQEPIAVDGVVGPRTISAIRSFQSSSVAVTDGLVEPNRSTIKALEKSHLNVVMKVALNPLLQSPLLRQRAKSPVVGMRNPDDLFNLYLDALRGE